MGVFVLRGIGFITQNYGIVIFWGGELNVFQVAEGQRKTEVIDLWSEDTKQDAWFTQSALDIGFRWLETAYPGFSVYLFSSKSHEQSNMNMKLVIMIIMYHSKGTCCIDCKRQFKSSFLYFPKAEGIFFIIFSKE